jgi:SAM-dependent methyltransferase
MSERIIGLQDWFKTPVGRYLLDWEQRSLDAAVADIFGYHALQLGTPELQALSTNRMPHRWRSNTHGSGQALDFATDFCALPFPAASLDLIVLPHALELSPDPHATLREVERVLVPEGRVVICGLNPTSLWGMRQRRARLYQRLGFGQLYLPQGGEFIGHWRLRDWLRLLSFEIESCHFGCYRPAVRSEKWLKRFAWMDRLGDRWWPIFGSAYFMVAVKRVHGMRLLEPGWKTTPARSPNTLPVTNRIHRQGDRPAPRSFSVSPYDD